MTVIEKKKKNMLKNLNYMFLIIAQNIEWVHINPRYTLETGLAEVITKDSFLRMFAANEKVFKLFSNHSFFNSKIQHKTFENKINIG